MIKKSTDYNTIIETSEDQYLIGQNLLRFTIISNKYTKPQQLPSTIYYKSNKVIEENKRK